MARDGEMSGQHDQAYFWIKAILWKIEYTLIPHLSFPYYLKQICSDSLYQSYLDKYEVIFQDRQKELSIQLENYVIPFFRNFLDQMNKVANGDSEAWVSSAKNVEDYVIDAFRILGMELSRELG